MAITFTPTLGSGRVEPPVSNPTSTPLSIKRTTMTFDSTWSPYIQGQLVCTQLDAAAATAVDPRNPLLAKFTLGQTYQGVGQSRDMAVWLRSRSIDYGTRETTLGFASAESLLQDQIDNSGNQYSFSPDDFTVIFDVLGRMPLYNSTHTIGFNNLGGSGGFTIAAADAGWDAGTSLWDIINTVESPKSLTIRGDEGGLSFNRQAVGYTADTSIYYMSGADRVISVTDAINRDSPDWANAVFINYRWNNDLNVASDYGMVGYTSGQPYALKSVDIEREGHRTATGEAQARANRMAARGRTLTVTAIADLSLRPNRPVYVSFGGQAWYGTLRAVTYRWPEGLMDLTVDITQAG